MRTRTSFYAMSAALAPLAAMLTVPLIAATPLPRASETRAITTPEVRVEWPPTPIDSSLALRRVGFGADGTLYVLRGSRAQGFDLQAVAPGSVLLGHARGGAPDTGYSYGSTTGGLPTRTFSIDRPSPTVSTFFAGSHLPDDLLTLPPPEAGEIAEDDGGTGPWTSFPGEAFPRHLIGPAPTLDLDALSRNHGSIVPPAGCAWRIYFSVPRNSGGDPGTGVDEQSVRDQQAGDLFESRQIYAPLLPDDAVAYGDTEGNELSINQDELLLVPSVGPAEFVAVPCDELDAWDDLQLVDETTGGLDERIYYSVKRETDPEWAMVVLTLPAGWDIGDAPPLPTQAPIYASRFQLGLTSNDDIDALVVFDADGNGAFTDGDAILLSLRPGSTSLEPGFLYKEGPGGAFAGTGSSADVFCVFKDGPTFLSRLATKGQLGLGVTPGEVDALEVRSAVIEREVRGMLDPIVGPLHPLNFVIH